MPGGRVRLAPGRAEAVIEWAGTGAAVDGFVATTLLETALIHALAMGGYVVNHAAALEVDGGALLVAGPSRAGKSTLSAAVLAAGGAVVSDDSVILGFDDEGAPAAGALRRDLWLREELVKASADCPPVEMNAEDPLFILYTSGSTGKPKGALHTTGGYITWASMTHLAAPMTL